MLSKEQEKLIASERLVLGYRSWADFVRSTNTRVDSIVFMDDLSNIPRQTEIGTGNKDWIQIFHESISSNKYFSDIEILKIKQSISFSETLDLPPTKKSIEECGGIFPVITMEMIDEISNRISELEKTTRNDFPTFNGDIAEYAEKTAHDGFMYLKSKAPYLLPINTIIEPLNPDSPFGAQVVTDNQGRITCQMRVNNQLTPKFIDTIIHEMLGHVLHFTQLKSSKTLQASSPHLLCLTLHTHEPFFIEAIAQLMTSKLLQSDWNLAGKELALIENLKFRRTLALVSKLLTEIFDGTIQASDAARIHCEYTGEVSLQEKMETVYKQSTQDLFIARVRLNYHPAFMAIEPLLDLDDSKFYVILETLLTTYFTPQTLKIFVAECIK